MLGELKTKDNVPGPRKSVWVVDDKRLDSERDGKLDEGEALWKVVNPNRTNARGYNTGYVVESHSHADPLLKKADFKRAGFIEHHAVDHPVQRRPAVRRGRHAQPESGRAGPSRVIRATTRASSTPTSCCG